MTSGMRIDTAVRQLCLLASAACGPSSIADRPPARWRDATSRSGKPISFRSSRLLRGCIHATGSATSCGRWQLRDTGSVRRPDRCTSLPFRRIATALQARSMYSASSSPLARNASASKVSRYHTGPD